MTPRPHNDSRDRAYVVIAGHGRSGSNRLLDAFDCHPLTFCRNEPNEASGSAFEDLQSFGFFPEQSDAQFVEKWRYAVSRAGREISFRDRINTAGKSYARPLARRLYARNVLARRRVRKTAALIAPFLAQETWPACPYYADPKALAKTLPVFKLLLKPGWILDSFPKEPGMRVILNIRSPRSFLQSWRHRYARREGLENVFERNLQTLDQILNYFGRPKHRLQTFSEEALYETELWRWRYMNESLFRDLGDSERFTIALYEAFEDDPIGETARLYDFAGLEFDSEIKAKAGSLQNTLFIKRPKPAAEEKSSLDAIIADILSDSPLLGLWDEAARPVSATATR